MSGLKELSNDFNDTLVEFFNKRGSTLTSFQKKAWNQFQLGGLPTRKSPFFNYIPLRTIYEKGYIFPTHPIEVDLANVLLPECQNSHITFLDGIFCPSLSKIEEGSGVAVLDQREASSRFSTFLLNREARILQTEKDPFALLNHTFGQEGAFLYIPAKKIVKGPLQIIFLSSFPDSFVFPKLHIFAGKESFAHCIINQVSQNTSVTCSLVDCAIESGAKIKLEFTERNVTGASHFFYLRATLKENSCLTSVAATGGASLSRHDYHVSLEGENAECDLAGAWVLDDKNQHHSRTYLHHKSPHTRSKQKFKGVLNDFTRSSFEGMIFVDPLAQKTEAYQVNHNLLLSSKALAYTKPNLEVFADDVKASHGATIGQIEGEQLFYLRARGIEEKVAKALLVEGFIQEILDTFSIDPEL